MSTIPDRPPPPRSVAERLQQWLAWVGPGRVATAALAVLAVLAAAYWLVRPPDATTESQLPYASPTSTIVATVENTTSSLAPTTTASGELVVHVAGAVTVPGVYRIRVDGRVIDAIDAAGGMQPDADLDAVNLAAPVRDGERVYVPRLGQPVPSVVTGDGGGVPAMENGRDDNGPTAGGPINLNTATASELEVLPGVGPATASAIVAHREEHGPFATIDDLTDVAGIGPAKLDAVRGLVTV